MIKNQQKKKIIEIIIIATQIPIYMKKWKRNNVKDN